MNRLLFALATVIVLAACGESEKESKEIVLTSGTSVSQTLYADETQKPEGIKFTATAPWTASVKAMATTRPAGSEVDWLTLSAYDGKAGEQSLSLTLKTNLTKADRKAEIKIVSGGTMVTIVVEQKALTKDGNTPEPERPEPSGTGTLRNENTNRTIKLAKAVHDIAAPGRVRITFISEKVLEDGKEITYDFMADFYNPLANGRLKAGTYTVRPINVYPYPEMTDGDCGWSKSVLAGYGEAGTVKVEYSEQVYTFTIDLKTGEGELQHTLKGTFAGVPEYLNEEIKVASVTLSDSQKTLAFGGSHTLGVTVLPADATDKRIQWSSSNTAVATVNENGLVTAVAAGEATITATSVEGKKAATCSVTVAAAVAVQSIKVEPTEVTLLKGEYNDLIRVTVLPENAHNKNYTWKSSNEAVAIYTGKGVEAKSAGTTTITYTTEDGSKTATLKVTVKERDALGSGAVKVVDNSGKNEDLNFALVEVKHTIVSKDRTELVFVDDSGNSIIQLRFFNPLSNKRLAAGTYTFKSPETSVAGTASNVSTYWGMGYFNAGTAVVSISADTYTFTMNNVPTTNGRTVTCSYSGKLTYTNEYVDVTSVQLNRNTLSLNQGEQDVLTATVNPANAFNKKVVWSSSNSNIVDVNDNGTVYARQAGTATITVTTEDGGKTATCAVTVNALPSTGNGTFANNASQSVVIKRATHWVNEKDPKEVTVYFYPEGSTEAALSLIFVRSSSDTGTLKAGTYTTIPTLLADKLGVKYSSTNTGSVTVTVSGDNYTVALDVTATGGIRITGSYSGKLPKP